MTADEIVEACARARYERNPEQYDCQLFLWDELASDYQDELRNEARLDLAGLVKASGMTTGHFDDAANVLAAAEQHGMMALMDALATFAEDGT